MKHHWNYRVFRNGVGLVYIAEVHYEDDKPMAYSVSPMPAMSEAETNEEALKEIRSELTKMLSALDKPVLTEGDFQ